jgi:hypothetical protein
MFMHSFKTTLAAALVLTTLGFNAEAADRSNTPSASSTPTHLRAQAAGHKAIRIVPFTMKCGVFSLSGADSRHVVVWRTNGMPVPAGTKVKLKVLNHTSQSVLPALGQGAKHMVLNATGSPVPHKSPCQAKVI